MAKNKDVVDLSGFKTLKNDIKENKIQSLYLFHGEEGYLKRFYLSAVKKALIQQGFEDFNYHVIDTKDFSVQGLQDEIDALPMMAERSLIVVSDFDLLGANAEIKEKLQVVLADLPEYVCVIFLYTIINFEPDGRMKFSKFLQEKAIICNFAKQNQTDLVNWVQRRFSSMGKDISLELSTELLFYCGTLMDYLVGEIEKIGHYAKAKQITMEDIRAVAIPELDVVVFQMTDALGNANFDKASEILSGLYLRQEPPIKIFGALGKQIRELYGAKLCLNEGKDAKYLSKLYGLHIYPAGLRIQSARKFTLAWCQAAVILAQKTDLKLKSTGRDGQEVLTEFILELANLKG
ncbi:MAG: DNA polymerase III subunit delta [Eubacteriales bacterium]